ncbi:hypothetical protein DENSPDRAFT_594002 [Dentipellis sp. KUC8613]|nr:hypothetical protein DENSPDRAFT_594002 [Dentipellis sp. KUC8613]
MRGSGVDATRVEMRRWPRDPDAMRGPPSPPCPASRNDARNTPPVGSRCRCRGRGIDDPPLWMPKIHQYLPSNRTMTSDTAKNTRTCL